MSLEEAFQNELIKRMDYYLHQHLSDQSIIRAMRGGRKSVFYELYWLEHNEIDLNDIDVLVRLMKIVLPYNKQHDEEKKRIIDIGGRK